jgi:predicted phage terminase large subunit-like protein
MANLDKQNEIVQALKAKYESLPKPLLISTLMGSFIEYLKWVHLYATNSQYDMAPHIIKMAEALQRYAEGTNEKPNLLIDVPVGGGKSTIMQYWLSWCFARQKNCMFLYVSFADKLIKQLAKGTRDVIGADFWINLFGDELNTDDKSRLSFSMKSGGKASGLIGTTVFGTGLGLSAGNPAVPGFSGALVMDDCMGPECITSQYMRDQIDETIRQKFYTRRRTNKTPMIYIAQSLHLDDFPGRILKRESEDWEVLEIPARMENGESYYPKRITTKQLDDLEKRDPYTYWSMYMQKPIQYGGTLFKEDWIRYYDHTPKNEELKKVFITVDTAIKAGEHNDYTVFSCWGLNKENDLYLLSLRRGKLESPEQRAQLKFFYKICKDRWRQLRRVYVEDKTAGTILIQEIKKDNREMAMVPIKRGGNTHKVDRFQSAAAFMESGRIYFPRYGSGIAEVRGELLAYDPAEKHNKDDFIDTMADACDVVYGKSHGSLFI